MIHLLAIADSSTLLNALGWLVGLCLIAYALWWGLGELKPREPFNTFGRVIIALFVVIVLIRIVIHVFGMP